MTNPIEDFKQRISYFSTFYSNILSKELPDFFKKDEKTQKDLMHDIYEHNSKLECLLRECRDEDIIEYEENLQE